MLVMMRDEVEVFGMHTCVYAVFLWLTFDPSVDIMGVILCLSRIVAGCVTFVLYVVSIRRSQDVPALRYAHYGSCISLDMTLGLRIFAGIYTGDLLCSDEPFTAVRCLHREIPMMRIVMETVCFVLVIFAVENSSLLSQSHVITSIEGREDPKAGAKSESAYTGQEKPIKFRL